MSRTFRNPNPKFYRTAEPEWTAAYLGKNKKVRDGSPQHASAGCNNNSSCKRCRSNRTFSSLPPLPDE